MAKMAERVTNFFIRYGVLKETDRISYAYCFELVFIFFSNFFAILLLSILFGKFKETIFYLIGFWPLRMLAGGYHAKTPFRCFGMTLFFFLFFILSLSLSNLAHMLLIFIFSPLSCLIIYVFAPVDCPNKRFREGQREILRRKSRIVMFVLVAAVLCSMYFFPTFSYALSCGIIVAACSLILSTLQINEEGGEG